MLGEAHCPPWPFIESICINCFKTGGPRKEHGTNKPLSTLSLGKVKMRHHMSGHLPESFSGTFILATQGMHHQEGLSQNDWLRPTQETNPSP